MSDKPQQLTPNVHVRQHALLEVIVETCSDQEEQRQRPLDPTRQAQRGPGVLINFQTTRCSFRKAETDKTIPHMKRVFQLQPRNQEKLCGCDVARCFQSDTYVFAF